MVTKNGVFQDEFFGTGFFHINGKKRRKKEKQLFLSEQLLSLLCWRTPIFPGRHQPSIFGTNELNFRVRDGNGWTLVVINTNCLCRLSRRLSYHTTAKGKMQALFQNFFKKVLASA